MLVFPTLYLFGDIPIGRGFLLMPQIEPRRRHVRGLVPRTAGTRIQTSSFSPHQKSRDQTPAVGFAGVHPPALPHPWFHWCVVQWHDAECAPESLGCFKMPVLRRAPPQADRGLQEGAHSSQGIAVGNCKARWETPGWWETSGLVSEPGFSPCYPGPLELY